MTIEAIEFDAESIDAPSETGKGTNRKALARMTEYETFVKSVTPGKVRGLPVTKPEGAKKDAPGDTARGLKTSVTRAMKRLKWDPATNFVVWDGLAAPDPERPDEKKPYLFVKLREGSPRALELAPPENEPETALASDEPQTTPAPDEPEAAPAKPGKPAK